MGPWEGSVETLLQRGESKRKLGQSQVCIVDSNWKKVHDAGAKVMGQVTWVGGSTSRRPEVRDMSIGCKRVGDPFGYPALSGA